MRPRTETPNQAGRALLSLVLLTALALAPVLVADYIRLDDFQHVVENPGLQGMSGPALFEFWARPYFGLYIPVTYSIWWLASGVAHLFGTLRQTAWLFHALNLGLHLANTCLVFLTTRTLLHQCREKHPSLNAASIPSMAFLAAWLFALHPVQVETVAWVSECKGGLSLLFGLLGIWSYGRRAGKHVTAILLVAAVLSKPVAIVIPGILLLFDRILLGRDLKKSIEMPSVLWLLFLPVVVITKHLQPNLDIDFVPTILHRIYVAGDALSFYLSKLFLPSSLALDYGRSPQYVLAHVRGWQVAVSSVVLLAAVAIPAEVLLRSRPRSLWYAFLACGWSVFVLALLPVLGLIPFEFQDFSTVADRYMYVAMFGAALALVGILIRFQAGRRSLAITVAILTLLTGLSFNQATKWRSTETLFAHTLRVNPRSYVAHYSIAGDLIDHGHLDEGIGRARQALDIKPDYLPAQVAIGVGWTRKSQLQMAIDCYSAALANASSAGRRHAAVLATLHNNLGTLLRQVGRRVEGTEHFRKAAEVNPKSLNAYLNLAEAALDDGQYLEAIVQFQHALALSPGNASIESQLARARRGARKALFGESR
jgi:tetratricopeptide (TPR) repeat protein